MGLSKFRCFTSPLLLLSSGAGGGGCAGPGPFNEILRGFELSQSNTAHHQTQSLNRYADANDKAWSSKTAVYAETIFLFQPLPDSKHQGNPQAIPVPPSVF